VKGPTPFWGGNVNTPTGDGSTMGGLMMTSNAVSADKCVCGCKRCQRAKWVLKGTKGCYRGLTC
jgi:hypothetical protein